MTNRDLFRLAKISLAARKKSTRSTVRGIAFGLILLVPVLFIALGIFGNLNAKVNENPEVLYLNYSAAAERTGIVDTFTDENKSAYGLVMSGSHVTNVAKNVKTDDVVVYEQIHAPFNPYMASKFESEDRRKVFDMNIGGSEVPVYLKSNRQDGVYNGNQRENYSRTSYSVPFAAIIDTDKTRAENFFTRKMDKKFDGVFVSGMDKGFSGDGKGQVVLSEVFLKSIGRTASEFYGKNLSISFVDSRNSPRGSGREIYINPDPEIVETYIDMNDETFRNDYENSSKDIYFCYEYEVVGIIKEAVTQYAMDTYGAGGDGYFSTPDHLMTNMMFFTSASQYIDEDETLEPVINLLVDENDESNSKYSYLMATFTRNESEFKMLNEDSKYMGFGANCFNSIRFTNNYGDSKQDIATYSTSNVFVDAASYSVLDGAVATLKNELSGAVDEDLNYFISGFTSEVYSQLSTVYNAFTYVVLALSVMGGIIFFASMVNLFNSIVHSVDSRKSYLGVLRAVGAKRSLINKMYMAESLTIFKRALIWILIFATVICVGIALLLNKVLFGYINDSGMFPFTLGVSYVYIPVALGIALAVLLLLGFAFSYGCSWKVSRDPITKTLAG